MYGDWLLAGRSGDRIPVGARFFAPVQTGPVAQTVSCIMGNGSFPGVKSGRGVKLNLQQLLVPWSRKIRTVPLLTLWAGQPVQILSACTRLHFTFLPYSRKNEVLRMGGWCCLTTSCRYQQNAKILFRGLHGIPDFMKYCLCISL